MTFDLTTWKQSAADRLRGLGAWLKDRRQDAPYAAYGALCGMSLWPLVEAARRGETLGVMMALGAVAGGVGGNLVANQIQDWKDRADAGAVEADAGAGDAIAGEWVARAAPGNAELREALDAVLDKLDAVTAAQAALSQADRQAFTHALRDDLQRLGNLPRFEAQLKGGGAIAQGQGARAVGARGVLVDGNVTGPIVTGDHNLAQQAAVIFNLIAQITQPNEDAAQARELIAAYLSALIMDCSGLKLSAIDQGAARPGRQPLELADVYVDLNTTFAIPGDCSNLEEFFARDRANVSAWLQEERLAGARAARAVSALDALSHHRELILLGKPGSGKSTFSGYVVLNLAQAALGNGEALNKLGPCWSHGPLLPVRVVLRQFAAELPAGDQPGRAGDLWSFIRRELSRCGHPERTADLIQRIARQSGALFLLDGLDECGDARRQARVLQAVAEFKQAAGGACRFLITARPYAWDSGPDAASGVYQLADLDDEQMAAFIERWYRALSARQWLTEHEADEKRRGLLGAAERADLQPLARNPLLLTLMATLHTNRGRLPDDRVDLYDEVVNLLLLRWNERIGADTALLEALGVPGLTLTHLRGVVEQLAFEAHQSRAGQDDADGGAADGGAADLDEDHLRRAFARQLQGSLDKAGIVVEYIERRAGLLIGQGLRDGARHFTFPHRTFQEYLAACHLANQTNFGQQAEQLANEDPGHWREVLVLAARQAKVERGAAAADILAHGRDLISHEKRCAPVQRDWQRAILAGEQLLEIGPAALAGSDQASAVCERVVSWLAALVERNALPARERARAGRLLGRLGDPRAEVMRVDAMRFCVAPAGPFCMGSAESDQTADDDERPVDSAFDIPYAYAIGLHPVTNAQFRAFVEDNGYANGKWWAIAQADGCWRDGKMLRRFLYYIDQASKQIGERIEEATGPVDFDAPFNLDNHPAVGVSWYEAQAYTEWLTDRWRAAGRLSAEQRVSLPSEPEWEKAARGGQRIPRQAHTIAIDSFTDRRALARLITARSTQRNPEPWRRYPWGDEPDPERANYSDTGIETTSAAGCFAAGAGPYGCLDLSGNVYEWTRSCWGRYEVKEGKYTTQLDYPYPYRADDGRENLSAGIQVTRVLRGGSFLGYHGGARCAYRRGNLPDYRYGSFGFRVVVSPILF